MTDAAQCRMTCGSLRKSESYSVARLRHNSLDGKAVTVGTSRRRNVARRSSRLDVQAVS